MKAYRKDGWSLRRAYAGMSSDKTGEKPVRRKPKVSWARLILPGLVGPKPRPKGVGDGKQVNIPAPAMFVEPAGTEKGRSATVGVLVQARRGFVGRNRDKRGS
jgi:hypothetical protein